MSVPVTICQWTNSLVSGKLSLVKLPPRTLSPMKILPPLNILPMEAFPWENYPPEICPRENCPLWKFPPWENYFRRNPHPTYKSYKWKKKQNCKSFWIKESCATNHPYQNNQGPLWCTHDLTENTGLTYFLYRMKKSQKSNGSKNRQMGFTGQLYNSRRTKTRQPNY